MGLFTFNAGLIDQMELFRGSCLTPNGSGRCVARESEEENIVYRYLKVIVLSAVLVIPVAVIAQDRDHPDKRQDDQQSRRYEDKAHKDSHEWNSTEDQAYRRYLQDHHKKYNDFAKSKKKEQDNYWNWRHSHPDNDQR